MIRLGQKVRDKITGYEGIAVARAVFLFGCSRVLVQPQETKEDGTPIEDYYIDEQRLEVIKEETEFTRLAEQYTNSPEPGPGGPQNDPTRAKLP